MGVGRVSRHEKNLFKKLSAAELEVRKMTHARGLISNEKKEEIFSFIAGGNSVLDAAKKYELTVSRVYGIIGWKKSQIHRDKDTVRRARGIEQAQGDPNALPEFEKIDVKAYRAIEVGIVNNSAQKRAIVALRWLEGRGKLGQADRAPGLNLSLTVPAEWRGRYGVVVEQEETDLVEVSATVALAALPAATQGGK